MDTDLQSNYNRQEEGKGSSEEESIFDGIHFIDGIYFRVFLMSLTFLCTFFGIFLIPVIIYIAYRAVKEWKLYLTQDSIHYTFFSGFSKKKWVIPLQDITGLYTLNGAKQIYIKMNFSNICKYNSWPCAPAADYISITYVANGQEFVDAVRKQMPNPCSVGTITVIQIWRLKLK